MWQLIRRWAALHWLVLVVLVVVSSLLMVAVYGAGSGRWDRGYGVNQLQEVYLLLLMSLTTIGGGIVYAMAATTDRLARRNGLKDHLAIMPVRPRLSAPALVSAETCPLPCLTLRPVRKGLP